MVRKLFNIFVLGSLVLAVITGWFWIQSSTRVHQFTFERSGQETIQLWSYEGKIVLSRCVTPSAEKSGSGQLAWASTPRGSGNAAPESLVMASAFSFDRHPMKNSNGVETYVSLPAWVLTAMFIVLPAWWLAKKIKPQKKKPAA